MVGYGLGWFLESYKGHYLAQHGGNINGFSAMVALFPLDDLGIAVFANANSTSLPDKLTRVLADRVLMLETDDWLAAPKSDEDEEDDQEGDEDSEETGRVLGTKPARAMAAYAGEYAHPAYGSVTVTVNADEDGLTVTVGEEKWELAHWHYEVFRAAGEDPPVSLDDVDLHFRANAQGRIVALEAQLEPSVDPISFERQPDQALLTPERLDRLVGSYKVNAQITLKITRRAQTLMVSQNGGPSLTLVPVEGTRFEIEEMAGFALEFELPASGPAPSMRAFEPGGSTVCERIEP